jgi:hypothetical protein
MPHATITAIKIALLSDPDHTSTAQCDSIRITAARLASIEERPGFAWEDQRNDWETVCMSIARKLEHGGSVPTRAEILTMITEIKATPEWALQSAH